MSYKELQIWKYARDISNDIHEMSLKLPKFELYETGSQIRRSSKSIRSNIVEGYGRKRYNKEFIRFIIYANTSKDETLDHLESLYETKSLTNQRCYQSIRNKLIELGKMFNGFLKSLEK